MNVIYSVYNTSPFYESRYKHQIYNLDSNDRFDFVVVGHSHARDSFLMNKNNLLNLGLSGQNLYWSDKMLVKFDKYISNNAVIMIETSFITFCQGPQAGGIRYLPLGFEREELGLTFEEYIIEKYLPFVGIDRTELILRNPETHFANLLFDFTKVEELNKNSIDYIDSILNSSCDIENFNLNVDILTQMISRERANGKTVVLYSAPLYVTEDQINTAKQSSRVTQFYGTINELANKLNVDYYDHSYLSHISNDYSYFRNANHLNNEGSLKYWEYFNSLIN
jgi:hypothetical protein